MMHDLLYFDAVSESLIYEWELWNKFYNHLDDYGIDHEKIDMQTLKVWFAEYLNNETQRGHIKLTVVRNATEFISCIQDC